ncbi:MAG: hypothetical protein BECKG1743D_GA0114223_112312 [Candidatus Kentron sp. G]|nr:MAG: hypothetical protein BECKG1743E_GA0114224_113113 [Candidatus Kentron sp. G]VFN07997.1 MAG: hypothetical protein BECKG1743D_GA0114223_112312 [Candidatus Kentron sp. G]
MAPIRRGKWHGRTLPGRLIVNTAFFLGSVIVLALLLFFPVSRLMWVLSVRRLERHLGHRATE